MGRGAFGIEPPPVRCSGRRRGGLIKRLGTLLILSFGLKLCVLLATYSVDPQRIIGGDTASYVDPARALVALGQFSSSPEKPSRAETNRTPGYPAFIAAVFALSGNSLLAVAVAQVAISTVSLAVTYLLAARWCGPQVAMAAAVVFSLDPLSLVYAGLLHTETLFTLFLLIVVLAGIALTRAFTGVNGFVFGASAACAALIRPIALYLFLPSLAAVVVRALVVRQPLRRIATASLVALLPWMVLVEGWKLRNHAVGGRAEFSQITGINLALYRGAGILAVRDGITFWEARDRMARARPDVTGWPPGAVSELYEREGLELIRAYPTIFIWNQLFGVLKIMAGPGRADLLHYFAGVPYLLDEDKQEGAVGISASLIRGRLEASSPFTALLLVYASIYPLALYVGTLLGLREIWRRRDAVPWVEHAFVGWVVLYLIVLAAGPEAYPRFRVPVMPLLAVYAALGWTSVTRSRVVPHLLMTSSR